MYEYIRALFFHILLQNEGGLLWNKFMPFLFLMRIRDLLTLCRLMPTFFQRNGHVTNCGFKILLQIFVKIFVLNFCYKLLLQINALTYSYKSLLLIFVYICCFILLFQMLEKKYYYIVVTYNCYKLLLKLLIPNSV